MRLEDVAPGADVLWMGKRVVINEIHGTVAVFTEYPITGDSQRKAAPVADLEFIK